MKAAVEYAERGWSVFPLWYGTKIPDPRFAPCGHKSATTDLGVVDSWPENINLGIACASSGLIVIDVDHRNGPDLALVETFPATHTIGTADGFHLYYLADELGPVRGKLGDGIDIKYNGYVVAPPSLHPDGIKYHEISGADPVPLPQFLLERILK